MNYIVSPSGKPISILNPVPEDFNIEDIARGLVSGKCERYGGNTPRPYYVAEHVVRAVTLFDEWVQRNHPKIPAASPPFFANAYGMTPYVNAEELARAIFLHDATEAYLGDIVNPLKRCLPDYKQIERHWEECICIRFGLPPTAFLWPLVKKFDYTTFLVETCLLDVTGGMNLSYFGVGGKDDEKILSEFNDYAGAARLPPLNRDKARAVFLSLAENLSIK